VWATGEPRHLPKVAHDVRPPDPSGWRRHVALACILLVAFGLRLAWVLAFTAEPVFIGSGDAYFYHHYGQQIAAGAGYLDLTTGEPTAYYPVGYPALLGLVYRVVDHLLAATVLNVAAGTVTVALAYFIGLRTLGRRQGLVAAALVAVHPNLIFYASLLQLETVFTLLLVAGVALLVARDWRAEPPRLRWLVLLGLLIGATTLVRPFVLPLIGAMVVALLVAGHGFRRAAAAAGTVALTVVVVVLPWTVRNLHRFDTPVLLSSNFGDTACLDRWSGATGGFAWAVHEGCVQYELAEDERNAENLRLAVQFVIHEPTTEAKLIARRAALMMGSDHDGLAYVEATGQDLGSWRPGLERLADVWFVALSGAALIGLVRFTRRRTPEHMAVVVAATSVLALPLLLWGSPRFHLPVVPLLAVLAVGAWPHRSRLAVPPAHRLDWRREPRSPRPRHLARVDDPHGPGPRGAEGVVEAGVPAAQRLDQGPAGRPRPVRGSASR
jgi:4-amino-4-deoxy-L-arabinose transferase-like glycosyltransferase